MGYSPRVEAAFAAVDGWTLQDFIDLALAAADQAGASVLEQAAIAKILYAKKAACVRCDEVDEPLDAAGLCPRCLFCVDCQEPRDGDDPERCERCHDEHVERERHEKAYDALADYGDYLRDEGRCDFGRGAR